MTYINYKQQPKTRTTVELCENCGGSGITTRSEMTDYHRREYDSWTEECIHCGGSGRMEVTTTIQKLPFVPKAPRPRL